jgi:hypothetical protein
MIKLRGKTRKGSRRISGTLNRSSERNFILSSLPTPDSFILPKPD